MTVGSGTLVASTAVIGEGSQIGRNSYIAPGVTVQCAFIGNQVSLHPGVRIGQDGFGYVPGPAGLEKVPSLVGSSFRTMSRLVPIPRLIVVR